MPDRMKVPGAMVMMQKNRADGIQKAAYSHGSKTSPGNRRKKDHRRAPAQEEIKCRDHRIDAMFGNHLGVKTKSR